ncbi:MAG: ferrous iron transport protein A [Anaerolineae bacterium]|nr:ferrous iron transport protein A [Anaerolineae bacterium]HDH09598.1 ferrous iron transport protein A [Chloroflexota bacterium]
MSVKTLNQLKPGERATIVKVGGQGPVRRRILDMGVVKGAEIEVVRVAPLGDPVEVLIKGYHLSLRKSEAQQVQVEV